MSYLLIGNGSSGQHDPLFAVATRPGKQAGGQAPWVPEEFFESGRRNFADVYRLLRCLGWRRMIIYQQCSASAVFGMLNEAGFTDSEMRVFRVAGEQGFHSYFFGRKP